MPTMESTKKVIGWSKWLLRKDNTQMRDNLPAVATVLKSSWSHIIKDVLYINTADSAFKLNSLEYIGKG